MTSPAEAEHKASKRAGGRTTARLAAVQALYEMELAGLACETVLDDFLHRRWGPGDPGDFGLPCRFDGPYFTQLLRGASEEKDRLDGMIDAALQGGWVAHRVEGVLRAILRVAAHEMAAHADVPAKVVINEYVALAADFFFENEPALVNGVLDRLARLLREDELEETQERES